MILPMIDVPVSLIGTFAVMAAIGFTLNNLTLFGLVLAIGIVVDDAIVVLENIERLIATGLDARTATIKAMEEITGPVLAITLVLSSVFVPCCFLGGITGQFFRQFAVTIAVSTIISAVNALTMTPSRAVLIFKTEAGSHGHIHKREALPWWIFGVLGGCLTVWLGQQFLSGHSSLPAGSSRVVANVTSKWPSWAVTAVLFLPGALVGGVVGWFVIRPVNAVLGWFFRGFNRLFDRVTAFYGATMGRVLRLSMIVSARLRRLARPDVLRLRAHAHRLHPAAGQGLLDPQRAAARLRLGGADPASDGPHRDARPHDPGGSSTRSASPASR